MLGGEVRAGRREGLWVVAAQAGMYKGKVRLKTWGPGHERSAR
jgi:hypothetical protein